MRHVLHPSSVLRRRLLLTAAAVSTCGAVVRRGHAATANATAAAAATATASATAETYAAAFAADRVDRAIALLLDGRPVGAASAIGPALLEAPDLFEDGAFVPMTIGAAGASITRPTTRLALLVDKNPTPLVAVFDVTGPVDAAFGVRVKMAETSVVRVLAWSTAQAAVTETRKTVQVVQGGCGDDPIPAELTTERQPGAMHIRAQHTLMGGNANRSTATAAAGASGTAGIGTRATETAASTAASTASPGVVVRVLMRHPMETGLRHDGAGRPVPAWFIDHVDASLDGRPLFTAAWGNAIAANPYLQFSLPTAAAGDRVGIAWTDTRGGRRDDAATVV